MCTVSKVARAFLLDTVISLNLHEHRGSYWRKTALPWKILEEKFPVPRNNAASKLGNGVILLLWQLRCHCNPDHNQEPIIGSYHNKFSSLSNTTVVAIFPNLCLWRRTKFMLKLGRNGPWKTVSSHLKTTTELQ